MLPTQVRLCDLAKLFMEILTPWEIHTQFLVDCLEMENILRHDKGIKLQNRLNLNIFSSLTHNSIPVTLIANDLLNNGDITMNSGKSVNS